MTDKEKIIAEIDKIIDRLKTRCNPNPLGTTEECLVAAEIEVLELVKGIIVKMKEEEPINEDLLDEIHNRWEDYPHIKWPKCPYKDFKNIACHFANWQKQQMMKNVTYGEVSQCTTYPYNLKIQSIKTIDKDLKVGDKVKLIIIKEE